MITNNRRMDLRIYFADSPSPIDVVDCCHLGTEDGLLRVCHRVDDEIHTQWWPLCKVFNIRQTARREEGNTP